MNTCTECFVTTEPVYPMKRSTWSGISSLLIHFNDLSRPSEVGSNVTLIHDVRLILINQCWIFEVKTDTWTETQLL